MILKPHHKRAARYLIVGMTAQEVAERLRPFTTKHVKQWRMDLDFKGYMSKLEHQYLELLDKDIEHVRRAATVRLQEIIEIPYNSVRFNMGHFEWAINKIFQITVLKKENAAAVNQLFMMEGQAVNTPEQKAALKQLVRVSSDPGRYITQKQGEA